MIRDIDSLMAEAAQGYGTRLLSVGIRSRWSVPTARAASCAASSSTPLASTGVAPVDVAEHRLSSLPPSAGQLLRVVRSGRSRGQWFVVTRRHPTSYWDTAAVLLECWSEAVPGFPA